MVHSLDEVEFIVNDNAIHHWKSLLPEMNVNEGWCFLIKDTETWAATFNTRFHAAVEKTTGKAVACVVLGLDEASENGEEALYSVGFFYTNPEWRGLGIGKNLFTEMIEPVGENNTVLNGVLKMVPKYSNHFGFDKILPFDHHFAVVMLKDLAPPIEQDNLTTQKLSDVPWENVLAYDLTICPRKREKFLQKFIGPADDTFTRIVFDNNNRIVGLACIRIDLVNNLIAGPVYGDSKEAARLAIDTILTEDINTIKHKHIGFFYPGKNTACDQMLQELSGGHVSNQPFARVQFTKKFIDVPYEKVYSSTECAFSFV